MEVETADHCFLHQVIQAASSLWQSASKKSQLLHTAAKLQDQANTLLRRLEAAQGMQHCLDIFHVVLATAANDSMAARWRGSY